MAQIASEFHYLFHI